jgi:hypothetical protein
MISEVLIDLEKSQRAQHISWSPRDGKDLKINRAFYTLDPWVTKLMPDLEIK